MIAGEQDAVRNDADVAPSLERTAMAGLVGADAPITDDLDGVVAVPIDVGESGAADDDGVR